MDARRVAPPPIVRGLVPVGRPQVGGRHRRDRGATEAGGGVGTPDLVAGPATVAVLEQHRAQRRRTRPVSCVEQIPIPTSSSCNRYRLYWINCRAGPELDSKNLGPGESKKNGLFI